MKAPSIPGSRSVARAGSALPQQRGGWWHHYVCPAHGTELLPDGIPGALPPQEGIRCPHGCRVDTPEVRGAWLVLSHQAWARHARVIAHRAARTGDPAVRAAAIDLLVAYAETYSRLVTGGEHEDAEGWMLRGRLFHQALTDAIWSVSIGHAVWSLTQADPQRRADLEPVLPVLDQAVAAARVGRDQLVADGRFNSNYTAWLNASGRVCARAADLLRGELSPAPAADEWLAGEAGQFAHILASTTPGGWEWEATTYYHGFVLRAYLLSLRGVDPAALPAPARERILAMIGVLENLATSGGILPAVHDGPYRRPGLALEWTELCALAAGFAPGTRLAAVAARARWQAGSQSDELEEELRLQPWFSGNWPVTPAEPPAVSVDPLAGIAVLRGDGLQAILDFGPHGGSHGHHDKLSLALYGPGTPWQPDPGQVPYGHRRWRAHYASAAAHPTVRIGDADPAEATGTLVAQTDTSLTVEVRGGPGHWYDGARAARHLVLADGYLLDVVHAESATPARLVLALRPDVDLEVRVDGQLLRSRWRGEQELHGCHLAAATTAGAACPVVAIAQPGPGPADDPQRERLHVDWTAESATAATWISVLQAGEAGVSGVELDTGWVLVRHAEGRVDSHRLPEACGG